MSPCRIHNIIRTESHCLHCRGFTDVWVIIITIIVVPKFVATNWYTILIVFIWLTRGPVNKSQSTVVWCPKERPFHGKVIPSDPESTTLPITIRTKIWKRKKVDMTNKSINTTIIRNLVNIALNIWCYNYYFFQIKALIAISNIRINFLVTQRYSKNT